MARGGFGNIRINFKDAEATLKAVFGAQPLAPHEMTKRLWDYVKAQKLLTRAAPPGPRPTRPVGS